MTIRVFNEIFVNKIINKRSMIILELIFIIILFLIIILFNDFYDYYIGNGYLNNDNTVTTVVNAKDMEDIIKNNELKINNRFYAYTIKSIDSDNYASNGYVYKMINIEIDNYKGIENNYIEYKIVRKKESLLNYFIRTMKGG